MSADREARLSRLELLELATGARQVVHESDALFEAPNWSRDGRFLVFNQDGRLFRFELDSARVSPIDTGSATRNNNDHVPSFDGRWIAISSADPVDGLSRILAFDHELRQDSVAGLERLLQVDQHDVVATWLEIGGLACGQVQAGNGPHLHAGGLLPSSFDSSVEQGVKPICASAFMHPARSWPTHACRPPAGRTSNPSSGALLPARSSAYRR